MIKRHVNIVSSYITESGIQQYVGSSWSVVQKLTKVATATIISSNNTPHASLRCAPWGVTFFRNNKTRQGYAVSPSRKGTPKPAGYLFLGVLK